MFTVNEVKGRRRAYAPFCRYPEYDNNINAVRISMGYSLAIVAEAIGVTVTTVNQAAIGAIGPFYAKNGKIKPWADKMCTFLSKSAGELWPFDVCDLKAGRKDGSGDINPNEFEYSQVAEVLCGAYTLSASCADHQQADTGKDMGQLLHRLSDREQDILCLHVVMKKTLDSIGSKYSLSRERVRQIYAGATRKVRRWANVEAGLEIETEKEAM